MAEKVVLEIDVNGLANSVLQAKANVDSYKLSVEALTEAYGENSKEVTIATAQLQAATKEQKQLEGQLLRTTQAQQALGESIIDLSEAYDAENKSIDQNRKVYNALYAEYIKADKAGREKLQPTMKKINDTLKEQEKAVGDTRRNVGNYTASITEAFTQLKGIGQVIDPIRNMGAAFNDAGGGVKGFGLALATTGLPLFISGINLLIGAFQSFKPIADAVENVTVGIGSAFKALASGGSIQEVTAAYQEQLEVMRDIEDSQISFNTTIEGYSNSIKQLLILSRNKKFSDEEQLKFLKDAGVIEENQLRAKIARVDKQLKKDEEVILSVSNLTSIEKTKLKERLFNEEDWLVAREKIEKFTDKETLDRYENNLLERERMSGESLALREMLSKREEDISNRKKDKDDKIIQEEKKARESYIKFLNDLESQYLLTERERIEKGFQDKLVAIKGNSQREILLRLTIEQEKQSALDKFDRDVQAKLDAKRYDAYIKEYNDRELALREIEANNVMLLELQRNFNASQEEIDNEFALSSYATFKEYYDAKKMLYEKDAAERAKADADIIAGEQAKVQAASIAGNAIINTIGLVAEAAGAGAKFQKAVAFAQVLVSQAIAIANAVVGATSSGASTGPAAIATTPAFIATMISSVLAVFGSLVSLFSKADVPSTPKFAEGGEVNVGGRSHSEGGTIYAGEDGNRFEVEKGEKIFVLKKSASRHIDALGGLNMAFGGRSWKDSPVSHAAQGGAITDGGFAIRATSQEANTMATLNTFAETIVSRLPAPVVSITEFENKQKSKNKSVRVSEL
jgi:hypothetical protein